MSLLDDVSIVVTPNGYKAGELYAVVPVPTEGAEEITNGDFATDLSGWTLANTNATNTITWETNGARIISTDVNIALSQNTLIVGKTYRLTCDVAITVGKIGLDGITSGSTVNMVEGFNEIIFTAISTTFKIKRVVANSNCLLDNVSVKEYTAADMDVTRATAATRVDEAGLVNYAEIIGSEEVTNGDFATDSDWIKGTGWSIADGKATSIGSSGTNILKQYALTNGVQYILTCDIVDYTSGFIRIYSPFGLAGKGDFSAVGTNTLIFTASSSALDIASHSSNPFVGSIDNISVKEVTRDNVPRIDYAGGGCPHILAEPQRTNLIAYSFDFSTTYWTRQAGIVPTYNTTETLSPDGTYNATKFIGTGSTGVYKSSIGVSGNITRSVYLKSVSGTTTAVFKDPNALITSVNLTITNQWQRFELIGDNGTSSQGLWIDDITSDGLYMWGAQLEEASYATSYIPTSGSIVTRNQDQFSRDGIGSLINSTEGTFFLEMAALRPAGANIEYLAISDGTYNANSIMIQLRNGTNQFAVWAYSGGVTQVAEIITLTDITDFNKIAIKWKLNDFEVFVNGSSVYSLATYTAPTGLDRLEFSRNGTAHFFSKVKQLQVYKTALTDEQLIQLTGESGTDFYESYAEMASALTYTIQ